MWSRPPSNGPAQQVGPACRDRRYFGAEPFGDRESEPVRKHAAAQLPLQDALQRYIVFVHSPTMIQCVSGRKFSQSGPEKARRTACCGNAGEQSNLLISAARVTTKEISGCAAFRLPGPVPRTGYETRFHSTEDNPVAQALAPALSSATGRGHLRKRRSPCRSSPKPCSQTKIQALGSPQTVRSFRELEARSRKCVLARQFASSFLPDISVPGTAARCERRAPSGAPSSSYPDGHIDELAAQVGKYSRISSGPSRSVERWKYCANSTRRLMNNIFIK